jgi:uncharacterized protein
LRKPGILDEFEVRDILHDVTEKYKEVIKDRLVEIVLFGSYARKKPEEYSDVDIMVLIDDTDENIKEYGRDLGEFVHDLDLKYDVLITPIMINFEIFKRYEDILPFYMNIIKEGVKVYGREAA